MSYNGHIIQDITYNNAEFGEGVTVSNNSRYVKELLYKLKVALHEKYEKERKEIHVSDICLCPLQTWFRRKMKKPLRDVDLNNFTSGRAIHEAIQSLAETYPIFQLEKEVYYNDVVAHIDIYDKLNNIPIEAKSLKKATLMTSIKDKKTKKVIGYEGEKPKFHQIEQLKMYMAMTKNRTGVLAYQLLLNFEDYPFRGFEVNMTNDALQNMLTYIDNEKTALKKAIEENNPFYTRNIALNRNNNWLCNNCQYLNECLELRKNDAVFQIKEVGQTNQDNLVTVKNEIKANNQRWEDDDYNY